METAVFLAGAAICLAGAFGVILFRNPVHSALSLVLTLFGIAVLFIALDAEFLAAVQVIVYAGAIVVMFLFVIMLLGVDQQDDITVEHLKGQRPAAAVAGVLLLGGLVAVFLTGAITGQSSANAKIDDLTPNVEQLARSLFTDYLWAFEITSVLLIIAVVGAVTLARHRRDAFIDDDPADEIPGPEEVTS
ncbi:NADH-quinone oxidoreductase subunit J [Aquihabitans sp. McL0605]|uniref:NADH-quinone oxidoreductase subunit J n=1 Tax=Aquihabitans sp. McL0605 TaxID=3415671 RepID=UPI003CF3850A